MFYVYILKSEKDHELYIGSTNDLKRRLFEHNSGKVESTQHRTPFSLQYYETSHIEDEARVREHSLKYRGNTLALLKRRISKSLQ